MVLTTSRSKDATIIVRRSFFQKKTNMKPMSLFDGNAIRAIAVRFWNGIPFNVIIMSIFSIRYCEHHSSNIPLEFLLSSSTIWHLITRDSVDIVAFWARVTSMRQLVWDGHYRLMWFDWTLLAYKFNHAATRMLSCGKLTVVGR